MTADTAHRTSRYRIRLVIGFALVIALLAGAWILSLYAPLTAAVMDQQESHLLSVARAGALVIEAPGGSLAERVDDLAAGTDLRITVVAADGVVLADSEEDPARLENHGDRAEVQAALSGRTGTDVRYSESQGIDRMYAAAPATLDGEPVALRVSTSLAYIADLSASTRQVGLILLFAAIAAASLAVWRLSHIAAGPVDELADTAMAMARGDLSSPVPTTDSSLAPLSNALASLGEQIRDRIADLEAEQRTLRLVLDGLSDAVILLEDDRILLANRALAAMFRLTPTSARGRTLAELGLPASVEAAVTTRLDTTQTVSAETGPDPYRRYHRLLVIPLGEADGARRTLIVIGDVTDRMRLDAIRRDFVANASHELKTPTAGILLLAESADQAARDGDDAQALAFLSQIQAEAVRLRQLVGDLLDLSRLESAPTKGTVTDVRRSIELALAGHGRAATAKGLALETDLADVAGQDVAACVETTDLAVALDNLLSNAVTYTEEGTVTVRVTADDEVVQIAVADTGIGIPPGDVERVFERFYRVDRARSRTSGGTGLGLALVRNVAERAGGAVEIESEPGVGTTVTLRLRRAT